MVLDHAIHIVFIELFTGVAGQFCLERFGVVGQIVIEMRFLDCASSCSSLSAVVWSFTIIWANCFTLGFLLLAGDDFSQLDFSAIALAALVTKS